MPSISIAIMLSRTMLAAAAIVASPVLAEAQAKDTAKGPWGGKTSGVGEYEGDRRHQGDDADRSG